MSETRIMRYVPHDLVEKYEKNGWIVVSRFEGSHHSVYAVIMEKIAPQGPERPSQT